MIASVRTVRMLSAQGLSSFGCVMFLTRLSLTVAPQRPSTTRDGSFRDAEIEYLGSQRLGRLATVGLDGMPHVVLVAFRYNAEADTIDIGRHDFAKRKKFRAVKRTGVAALMVDDVLPPWQPRAVEATTLDTGGKAIHERFDDPIIRITPRRIVSWSLEDGF
jgi:pyridoxamine 5'-phosphate oxidase family protein